MKSQIFKNAWKLSKGTGMSFSNALKTAWDAFKNEVEIFISTSFNGMRVANYKKAIALQGLLKEFWRWPQTSFSLNCQELKRITEKDFTTETNYDNPTTT